MKHPRARYSDQLPYVIDTVSRRAEKGDVRAMNLFLHFVGVGPRAKGQRLHRGHAPHFEELLENGGRELEIPTRMEETVGRRRRRYNARAESLAQDGGNDSPRGETTIYSTSQHPIRQTT